MTKQSTVRRLMGPAIFVALILCLGGTALAQPLPREIRTQLISATVQVVPWDDAAGDMAPWSGSGTIISPDGYILTNFHVVGDNDTRSYFDWHAIFMTDVNTADLPPAQRYWARYIAGDPLLDLAILRIEQFPDESPVPAGTVFPAVPVGDSHTLLPGDGLTVVGYPGISGSTITFTQGIMSGWLGEDLSGGGRQWIKTDAKIAGGNSGGAAVNEHGELVGVPTAGIHTLDGTTYEEQLYIRPIALAWALIGPHVANVVRPSLAGSPAAAATPQTSPVTAPVPATSTSPVTPPAGAAVPSGSQGALAIGQSVSRTAASAGESVTWHTYVISVPAGQPEITVSVTSMDDIDFAFKFGSEIMNYNEVDFLSDVVDLGASQTISNPPAGPLYLDVLNAYNRPIEYTVSIIGTAAAAQVPGVPAAPVPPAIPVAPVTPQQPVPPGVASYPAPTPYGDMGLLQLGQQIAGNLQQEPADVTSSVFHTYEFHVPAGATALTILLDAEGMLNLAAKHGSQIQSYSEVAEGGDWHYWTWADEGGGTVTIQVASPPAGTWFLDVINYGNITADGRYTLRIDAR